MIELIKILEGGIDLRTGAEEPRSVVLQNGETQLVMPISSDQLSHILSLLGVGEVLDPDDLQGRQTIPIPDLSSGPKTPRDNGTPSFDLGRIPDGEDGLDDEPESGETYEDEETGVSSF